MTSAHEALITQVDALEQSCGVQLRQLAALKATYEQNFRELQAVLGQGGSGKIGSVMGEMARLGLDLDKVAQSTTASKNQAAEYAKHLRSLQ
ncbi:MAG: hypothetical protein WBZ04_07435 [Candidatus Nanopelagicales bacterium]